MRILLLDTNILIDVLQERFPFYITSQILLDPERLPNFERRIAAHSFATVSYLVSKHHSAERGRQAVRFLLDHFEVAPVTATVLNEAAGSEFADFEDAMVHAAARAVSADAITTRNTKDFAHSTLAVYDPEAFLSLDLE